MFLQFSSTKAVKMGEIYYYEDSNAFVVDLVDNYEKAVQENEKLRQENERLIRIEKEYNAHCEYLDSIEGIDIIRENKKLKDRVKELENACCEEAVKKNIALNAYEMTRIKLAEIFIEPTFLNDIYHRDYKKEKDEFIFTLKLPWEKAKTIFDKKRIKAILEYEKAEGRKDE